MSIQNNNVLMSFANAVIMIAISDCYFITSCSSHTICIVHLGNEGRMLKVKKKKKKSKGGGGGTGNIDSTGLLETNLKCQKEKMISDVSFCLKLILCHILQLLFSPNYPCIKTDTSCEQASPHWHGHLFIINCSIKYVNLIAVTLENVWEFQHPKIFSFCKIWQNCCYCLVP